MARMRLRVRSVVGVSLLLVLIIVLAYQAQNMGDESKRRIKRRHEKELRDRLRQKREKMVDYHVTVSPMEKLRVNFPPAPSPAPHRETNALQDTDHYEEVISELQEDTDHLEDANSKQAAKIQQVRTNHKSSSKQEAELQDHRNVRNEQDLEEPNYEVTTKSWSELFKKFKAFQPTEEVEFPTKDGGLPRIPHIIHQVSTDEYLIANYSRYIRTFVQHNPKWEYRFWSHESGRRLIAEKHPYLLTTFDNITNGDVKKSDLIKFTVMYEYGGLYSDIDVKNLRPLDIVTTKYACIIPTEPFEHASFLFQTPLLLNVGIFMCRPKHPFFKRVLQQLYAKTITNNAHPLKTTGAVFFTRTYMFYNKLTYNDLQKPKTDNSTNTPYFFKGALPEDDVNAIYIPNSQYFTDKVDPILLNKNDIPFYCVRFRDIQEFENLLLMPKIMLRGCAEYQRRQKVRRNKKYTFTEHYWHHIWTMDTNWLHSLRKVHIRDIVPHYKFY